VVGSGNIFHFFHEKPELDFYRPDDVIGVTYEIHMSLLDLICNG